jgi:hypothetical protein
MRFGAHKSRSNAKVAKVAKKNLVFDRCVLGVLCVSMSFQTACGGTGLFKQYEYEEDMYLSLDRSATLYVNSSIAALNALRGTRFDASPSTPVDRDAVRAYFTSASTRVTRVATSRRSGRRFVHVRIDVDDVSKLSEAAPFAWSRYTFKRSDDHYAFEQAVGSPASAPTPSATLWTGGEIVAFRLHLPSKIEFHNTGRPVGRGNILVWEQSLADRLHGSPLTLDARMQTQSILYRTLWLFSATFVAVAVAFAVVIWLVLRRGGRRAGEAGGPGGAGRAGEAGAAG